MRLITIDSSLFYWKGKEYSIAIALRQIFGGPSIWVTSNRLRNWDYRAPWYICRNRLGYIFLLHYFIGDIIIRHISVVSSASIGHIIWLPKIASIICFINSAKLFALVVSIWMFAVMMFLFLYNG
jgi:hypothetical protein